MHPLAAGHFAIENCLTHLAGASPLWWHGGNVEVEVIAALSRAKMVKI